MSQRKVPLERLDRLWDSERALTTQEADERRARFGANDKNTIVVFMHYFSPRGELQGTVNSQVASCRHVPVDLFPTRKRPQKKFKRRLVAPTDSYRQIPSTVARAAVGGI